MHDKRRNPEVLNNIRKQQLHSRWLACIACVSTHAVRLLQPFSRTDLSGFLAATPTTMPFFANSLAQLELMPGPPPTISATSVFRRLSVGHAGSCHVSCSHTVLGNDGRGSLDDLRSGFVISRAADRLACPSRAWTSRLPSDTARCCRRRVQQHKAQLACPASLMTRRSTVRRSAGRTPGTEPQCSP